MTRKEAEAVSTFSKPTDAEPPDIASASVPDALAALGVNAETGLSRADVDARRKEHGFNEVAEKKGHPVLVFLGKFWGVSAWMLELIMVLPAVLGKYSDLAVVRALLVVNAVLSTVCLRSRGSRLRRSTRRTGGRKPWSNRTASGCA